MEIGYLGYGDYSVLMEQASFLKPCQQTSNSEASSEPSPNRRQTTLCGVVNWTDPDIMSAHMFNIVASL